ncbi:uncharacterized protein B0H18DRAFT_1013333 [Fomitopsis serialis]|uniref:uncharacterized protein n=1 Tax=Fomitopsis serialis TaxID=139415 RepID=UPI0020082684|nr:uncharacterized protein B0H18DRAFT_1013333 [Neoantrodia serialis]KAH9924068.1 hypothetical protein B0H18DRAFT_1013333 [Neoantrodia serialis]
MHSMQWSELAELEIYHWCGAASAALLFYDYILTFPREVRCIWGRRLSGATLLFLVNRYFTIIVVAFNVCSLALSGKSGWYRRPVHEYDSCPALSIINQTMSIIFALVNAAFHSLRVYAICPHRSRAIIFSIVFMLEMVPASVDVFFFTRISDFGAMYLPFNGCEVSGFSGVGWYYHLSAAIAADAVVVMLTYWRTMNIHRALLRQGRRRTLASMILKDGALQLTILNIATAVGVRIRNGIVAQFAQVLASIVFSRFILDLRSFYLEDNHDDAGQSSSDAAFSSSGVFSTVIFLHGRLVGNFGAPVGDWLEDSHEQHGNCVVMQDVAHFSDDPLSAGLLQ